MDDCRFGLEDHLATPSHRLAQPPGTLSTEIQVYLDRPGSAVPVPWSETITRGRQRHGNVDALLTEDPNLPKRPAGTIHCLD
jgi:hypothetical protein